MRACSSGRLTGRLAVLIDTALCSSNPGKGPPSNSARQPGAWLS